MTGAAGDVEETPPGRPDAFPLPLVHLALAALGVALATWGAFLIPLRLFGHLEGLAVLIAFAGNLGAGFAAARATREASAAVSPGVGWLVTILVLGTVVRPSDEVVIAGRLPTDPGIGTVGTLFLLAGVLGTVLAAVLAARFTRRARRPTTTG